VNRDKYDRHACAVQCIENREIMQGSWSIEREKNAAMRMGYLCLAVENVGKMVENVGKMVENVGRWWKM
jgi:hypothetical protein